MIFETIDKTGRKIHLSKERWSHITTSHPYMVNYLNEIEETIKNPLKIIFHGERDLMKYYKYLKYRKYPEKYFRVIVKYLNEHGFILTAHFVRDIK